MTRETRPKQHTFRALQYLLNLVCVGERYTYMNTSMQRYYEITLMADDQF